MPEDLAVVLEPVAALWARLERAAARRRVQAAARREVARLRAWLPAEEAAEWLAGRLMDRLARQGGPEQVRDPVGWLLGRGLPPRETGCGDTRCLEGTRMDTRADCPACAYQVADRRAARHALTQQVDAELPDAEKADRRSIVEQRLRAQVAHEHEQLRARREAAAQDEQHRQAAAAAAQARAALAEQQRQAQPCTGCGAAQAAGWCSTCAEHARTEQALQTAALTAAAAWADTSDPADIDAVRARLRRDFAADLEPELADAKARGATAATLAHLTRLAAETTATETRRSALALLARTPQATTESQHAFAACRRTAHRYPTPLEARQAATNAAAEARARTAELLLKERTAAVHRTVQTPAPATAVREDEHQQQALEHCREQADQVRAALARPRSPRRSETSFKTRQLASAGYQRALNAHLEAKQRQPV